MPDVDVPADEPMNFLARDLRPHMSDSAQERVEEELMPKDYYRYGLIPSHFRRAGKSVVTGSLLNKALASGLGTDHPLLPDSTELPAIVADEADSSLKSMTAPVRPDRVADSVREVGNEEDPFMLGLKANQATQDALAFVRPYRETKREYTSSAQRTAEEAARRAAKARRKKERRDLSGWEKAKHFLLQKARDNKAISESVREGGGRVQADVPSPEISA